MSYEPHTWQSGETISADLLNNMEDGVKDAVEASEAATVTLVQNDDGTVTIKQG